MSVEVFCRFDQQRGNYEYVVRARVPNGQWGYMHPPTYTEAPEARHQPVPDGFIWREDNLDLASAFAQAAWEHGWRPKGFGTEDVSTLKAHLDDKREEVRWLREMVPGPEPRVEIRHEPPRHDPHALQPISG